MSLITVLMVLLLIPFVVWSANRKLCANKLADISVSAISAIFVYILILLSVWYIEKKYDAELLIFDLNNDGFFSGKEITPEQEKAMYKVTADTARNFAPFTGAIFSFIYFVGVWLVFLTTSWMCKQRANNNT